MLFSSPPTQAASETHTPPCSSPAAPLARTLGAHGRHLGRAQPIKGRRTVGGGSVAPDKLEVPPQVREAVPARDAGPAVPWEPRVACLSAPNVGDGVVFDLANGQDLVDVSVHVDICGQKFVQKTTIQASRMCEDCGKERTYACRSP